MLCAKLNHRFNFISDKGRVELSTPKILCQSMSFTEHFYEDLRSQNEKANPSE